MHIAALSLLSKVVGRQKWGVSAVFQSPGRVPSAEDPSGPTAMQAAWKPLPWAEGTLALQDKESVPQKQERKMNARLRIKPRDCLTQIRAAGFAPMGFSKAVNLMHLQRLGNICRCCYQSATLSLSHLYNRSRDTSRAL